MWTFSVILIGLWLVAMMANYTLHGYVHLLFALALVLMIGKAIRSERRRLH
jgi:hypothetical protein